MFDPFLLTCTLLGGSAHCLDFLKVLRFSFPVPVVGPSAKDELSLSRSLARFCRKNIKKLPLALRACEKIRARLVGKSTHCKVANNLSNALSSAPITLS